MNIYEKYNIDKAKLKRDYIENPLKKIIRTYEIPFKEDIEYLYNEIGVDFKDILDYFKMERKRFYHIIKNYDIHRNKEIINKNRYNTNIRKYGNGNFFLSKKFLDESLETNIKKYNAPYYACTKDFKEKAKETCLIKYGDATFNNPTKIKETCLIKYGVEHYSKSDIFKNLLHQNAGSLKNKRINTMIKNKTIGKSKIEDKVYNLLFSKFNEVKRQYKSDVYPFACDFYIPEIDLYIEYQGMWTHGKEPYLGTECQQEKIKL